MRKLSMCLMATVALAGGSCRNPHHLYPVSGKVLYRGQPAVNAAVILRRPDVDPLEQQMIMGIVQVDGSFAVVCESYGKGAPPGEYDVLIEWNHDPRLTRAGSNARHPPDRLKGRYADPKHPRFHVTVKAESNELPPFELTD
jgi:hypothetical protein